MDKPKYTDSWRDHCNYINLFFENNQDLKDQLKINQLSKTSIDLMIELGWHIKRPPSFLKFSAKKSCGSCSPDIGFLRRIMLHPILEHYDRDKTLFHELSHIHYDSVFKVFAKNGLHNSEPVIEWLARKHRANPVLLKHAIHLFELEPHIYDLPSYLAFAEDYFISDRKINFPKLEILMD
ncbi:MAG: hypothetical protein AABY22_12550 [Nanoarchaeota archaeon]